MRVRWLRNAVRDLDGEATSLAAGSRADVACGVVRQVLDATVILRENPGAGRTGRAPRTREFVVSGTARVAYRVRGDVVEVLRVFFAKTAGGLAK